VLGLLGAATWLPVGVLVLSLAYLENAVSSSGNANALEMLGGWLSVVGIAGSVPYVLLLGMCGWRTRGWVAGRVYLALYALLAGALSVDMYFVNFVRRVSVSGLVAALLENWEPVGRAFVLMMYAVITVLLVVRGRQSKAPAEVVHGT
jgi:hypothetical protein